MALQAAGRMEASKYAAETVKLTKVYQTGVHKVYALQEVDLKVRRGELLAVVGPSGSGKSTLLNLLGTLDKPTSGKVYIDGIDVFSLDGGALAELRSRKIGFIFQSYNLINRTSVLRNVELPATVLGVPRDVRRKRAMELLELMGLEDKAFRKPTELSGGEQQRVAIARALINNPAIVLADEPTGNLDSKTGLGIFQLLRRLCREKGATVVVVTHNLELAKLTDRIVHLRDGRIIREEAVSG